MGGRLFAWLGRDPERGVTLPQAGARRHRRRDRRCPCLRVPLHAQAADAPGDLVRRLPRRRLGDGAVDSGVRDAGAGGGGPLGLPGVTRDHSLLRRCRRSPMPAWPGRTGIAHSPDTAELARRRGKGLPPDADQLLLRWGYPGVFGRWRFHMTLTRRLDDQADLEAPPRKQHFAAALAHETAGAPRSASSPRPVPACPSCWPNA